MATGDTDRSPSAVPTTETDQTGAQVKQEAQEEATTVTDEEWRAMQSILNHIYAYRDSESVMRHAVRRRRTGLTLYSDHDPSKVFHRKVNKRALPEYYDVIKEPMALSTVKVRVTFLVSTRRVLTGVTHARQISTTKPTRNSPNSSGTLRWYVETTSPVRVSQKMIQVHN